MRISIRLKDVISIICNGLWEELIDFFSMQYTLKSKGLIFKFQANTIITNSDLEIYDHLLSGSFE
jgi:hypothetical protein